MAPGYIYILMINELNAIGADLRKFVDDIMTPLCSIAEEVLKGTTGEIQLAPNEIQDYYLLFIKMNSFVTKKVKLQKFVAT